MTSGTTPGAFDPAQDAQANAAQRTLFAGDPLCKIN